MFVKILDTFRNDQDNIVMVEFFYTIRDSVNPLRDGRDPDDSQNLFGKWVGEIPEKNNWYDVEIDVEDELVWNKNVFLTDLGDVSIKLNINGTYIFEGMIDVSDDGFTTLLIGKSLHVLEIVGIPQPLRGFVRVLSTNIRLFDTGILRY